MICFKSFWIGDRVKHTGGKTGYVVRFTNNLIVENTLVVVRTDTGQEFLATTKHLSHVTTGT